MMPGTTGSLAGGNLILYNEALSYNRTRSMSGPLTGIGLDAAPVHSSCYALNLDHIVPCHVNPPSDLCRGSRYGCRDAFSDFWLPISKF
jgi:hypothetical protein